MLQNKAQIVWASNPKSFQDRPLNESWTPCVRDFRFAYIIFAPPPPPILKNPGSVTLTQRRGRPTDMTEACSDHPKYKVRHVKGEVYPYSRKTQISWHLNSHPFFFWKTKCWPLKMWYPLFPEITDYGYKIDGDPLFAFTRGCKSQNTNL